jgi:hypothetical protein
MDNEPTLKIDEWNTKKWRLNGEYHRVDGPAVVFTSGEKIWYKHGECHREDGPAYEGENGDKDWYLDGARYDFDGWLEANTFISEEEKVMIKLIHG